jgi:enamine deaminase RidA (YjgF/YER057c/UK114 family)
MTNNIEQRLKKLGIKIPDINAPAANYVAYKQVGNLLYISGQTAKYNGELKFIGKAGNDYGIDESYEAAKLCCLNVIGQVKEALKGNLNRVKSCVKLTVYVNSIPSFTEHPKIANGASDLMVKIFEEKGKHTRVTVGCNSLPSDSLVEIDAIFEVEHARV